MTTNHAVSREDLMALTDGELAVTRAAEVEAHIGGCSECRTFVDSLRQVSGALNDWPVDAVPDEVRLPGSWWTARTRFGLRRWVLIALPTAAAAMLAVVVWQSSGGTPRISESPVAFPVLGAPSGAAGRGGMTAGRGGPGGGGGGGGRGGMSSTVTGQPVTTPQAAATEAPTEPMIARTVSLSIVTDHFSDARSALERVSRDTGGMVSALRTTGDPPAPRSLTATLRVPAAQLDKALAEVRKIGRVSQESQSSEDVGDAHRDLVVRIDNATKEEARLNDLLKNRTGRLQDVLAVEQEVTRVRTDIEQMKAQELAMRDRVAYATIAVDISEAYRAEVTLGARPAGTRLRNALVDGWQAAVSSAFDALLFILQVGPSFLLWMIVFGAPAFWLWRRTKRAV